MSAFEWNLFEDPESIIREGGWLKLVTDLQSIPEDYGIAWRLPNKYAAVCAPMPWHTIYGWAYRTYWRWRIGSGLRDDALQRAFDAGVAIERQHLERRIADLKADHQKTLAMHVSAAEHRGRQEMTTILESLIDAEFPNARGGRTH